MIFFALFSHMVSLLASTPSLTSAPLNPTVSIEITIEEFPESVELPVCFNTKEVNFVVRIVDNCFGHTDLSTFNFDGNAFIQFVSMGQRETTLYMLGNVFLSSNGETWTAEIEDPLGNVSQASVNLNISQADEFPEPVITPPGYENYTIPNCETAAFGILSFLVEDDCTPINPAQIIFDDGGLGLDISNRIIIQNDPFHAYVEFAGEFTSGVYDMTATYQDVSESFTITVTQEVDSTAQLIFPGNPNWVLPGCEMELLNTFSITILSECEDAVNPEMASFSLGGEIVEPIFNNVGYFEFLQTFTLDDDSTYLVASYENEFGMLTKDSILINISSFCNTCPPVIECLGIENQSTEATTCTAEIAVPTPSILGNVDTVVVIATLFTDVLVELVDDNGEPTGEFVTVEMEVASLEAIEGNVSDLNNELGSFPDISPGIYRISYTVINAIGDTTIVTCPFQVEDLVEPTVICNDHLNIVVNGDETVTFQASTIDEGSFDHCGPIKVEVRRSHTVNPITCDPTPVVFGPWSEQITFNNCDLEETVTIELRVWDDRNGDGIPGNTIEMEQFDGSTAMITDNHSICSVDEEVYTLFHPWSLVDTERELDHLNQTSTYQLLQNAPNPFSERTLIGFRIPAETQVGLKVHDLNGRILHSFEARFEEGYHEVPINKADLQASGVLFYTLETADFTATRKMVVLE